MKREYRHRKKALANASLKIRKDQMAVEAKLRDAAADMLQCEKAANAHVRNSQEMDQGIALESRVKAARNRLYGATLHDATAFSCKCRGVKAHATAKLSEVRDEIKALERSIAAIYQKREQLKRRGELLGQKRKQLNKRERAEYEAKEESALEDLYLRQSSSRKMNISSATLSGSGGLIR